MQYTRITEEHVRYFREIITEGEVITEIPSEYCHDYTEDLHYCAEVLIKVKNKEEISKLLRFCNAKRIPVTPAGARTGLSGGMLPVFGGVLLSLEKMDKIEIDTENLLAIVEPGAITQRIQEEAEKYGLMYPPDPASRGSCTIGGNLAENSGGPHAVKYGVTKDFVLELEAVLPTGEIIRTGSRGLKDVSGYNLTQLLVGSEGTLAVITRAALKLLPKPKYDILLLSLFPSMEQAVRAVNKIFLAGILPSALEFMEKDAIDYAQEYLGISTYNTQETEALLLMELDGNHKEILEAEAEKIYDILEVEGVSEVLLAVSSKQKEELWKLRRIIGEAVKMKSVYKEEDAVVPRAELPRLLRFVKNMEKKYGFKSVCYGHAGDGNIHINILKENLTEKQWKEDLDKIIRELFEFVVRLGGTLTGEHGIGWVQKKYMDIRFSETELALMRGIKKVFDPNNILNPGKILD